MSRKCGFKYIMIPEEIVKWMQDGFRERKDNWISFLRILKEDGLVTEEFCSKKIDEYNTIIDDIINELQKRIDEGKEWPD